MRLNAPTQVAFYISILFIVIGTIFFFVPIFSGASLIVLLSGYAVLVYGVVKTGV